MTEQKRCGLHKQVYVKVNAPCDKGIAPLVAALSEIEGLETLDSCENGAWGAYVFFTFGATWQDLATLLQNIASLLSETPLPCGYSFSLEWLGSNEKPRARLSLESEHVASVTQGIQRIVTTLNARMTAFYEIC